MISRQKSDNVLIEEKTRWWHNYLFPLYIICAIAYLIWRFELSFIGLFWYTIPLFVVEAYNTIVTVIHLHVSKKIAFPQQKAPIDKKTVDAFIPTYNEPEEIVEMTAIAAKNIYGIRNVYVLDDGKRENIKQLAKKIGVNYLARDDNKYAKAGNMNFGLKHSDSEFVLFFDCDHVPSPQFLEKTLPYFLDEKLAFVQTPQLFYNTDTIEFRKLGFRNLWNEQTMFYESIQPAKNVFGAGFFCGTGAILRRSALDTVGGFATETATEDIHTSLRLHAKLWKSLFINEKLVYGLAPEDLKEYHKQRVRWGAGSLGLLFRSNDSPLRTKGLTLFQRLCYFNSTNAYFYGGIIKLFYLVMPVAVMLSLPFVKAYDSIYLFWYLAVALPFVLLSNFAIYAYSRKTYNILYTEQYNIANIFSCIEALKGVFKIQKKFRVSLKAKVSRENHFVYYCIVALFIILLGSEIFGILFWFNVLGKNLGDFTKSFDAIAIFWNTWNLVIVGSFIWFLQNYNKRKHTPYAFAATNNIVINNLILGKLTRIGLSGAYIVLDSLPRMRECKIEIYTKNGQISLVCTMGETKLMSNNKVGAEIFFVDTPQKTREQLIKYFFGELVSDLFKNDFVNTSEKRVNQFPVVESYSFSRAEARSMPQ